ncbi:MAG: acyl-ACP--UDP-N-acetylglucosamine O-acyltransferase [Planctomycetes bacterium]|nr:acyl-ACP--UDP-N-acetylglucosamine O-acyltransferase [Planctomycetota bacterium]
MAHIDVVSEIAPGAQVDDSACVGRWCVIGPEVRIGPGTRLTSHVTVLGRTTIGRDNAIAPGSVIGGEPQDKKYRGGAAWLVIGDRNRIGRNVTINVGTELGGRVTYIGDDNVIDDAAHVAHDCYITHHVQLHRKVLLAGHIVIEPGAVVESMTGIHHFVRIGRYCRIGTRTPVRRDVPPYVHYYSHDYYWDPPMVRGLHDEGIAAAALPARQAQRLRTALEELFGDPAAMAIKIHALEADAPLDPEVAHLCQFCREGLDGTYGRYRERFRNQVPPEAEQYLSSELVAAIRKENAPCL